MIKSIILFQLAGLMCLGSIMSMEGVFSQICDSTQSSISKYPNLRFPAEWEPHTRTIMSYPSADYIWGSLLPRVQNDITNIAKAVAKFEPVVMLIDPYERDARSRLESMENITTIAMRPDDLWARDTVPIFLTSNESQLVGINLRFNGWGKKQEHYYDSKIAGKVLNHFKIDCVRSPFIAEGGSFESDGQGTILVTESSIINKNRNPGKSKSTFEMEIMETFGAKKVIWFPGVKDQDITDAHVDCLARFAAPGIVVLNVPAPGTPPSDVWAKVSREAKEILEVSTDAAGNKFQIIEMAEPDPDKISFKGNKDSFLTSYVNYLITNGGVVIPKFGDQNADENARSIIQGLYKDREIVQIQIDTVASGGGGIHCATHDMPHF